MYKYLLPIIFVCIWSCEEENSEGTTVNLWGEQFSVENTTELNFSLFDNVVFN